MRRAFLTCLLCLLPLLPTRAATVDFNAWQHTVWPYENQGISYVVGMAQTPNGYLWLATVDGLFRFDGVNFARIDVGSSYSPDQNRPLSLHAAPNGDLYILFFGRGVSVLHPDGRIDNLTRLPGAPPQAVTSLVIDHDGSLWTLSDGVHHFAHGRWTEVPLIPGMPPGNRRGLLLDQQDRLWASGDHGAWQLDRSHNRFVSASVTGGGLSITPDGQVWLIDRHDGGLRLLADALPGARRPADSNFNESRVGGLIDASGIAWSLRCGDTLCLLPPQPGAPVRYSQRVPISPPLDQFDLALEDREGNLWLNGREGLHRLRPRRLQATALNHSGGVYRVASDGAGQTWLADDGSGQVWLARAGQAPVLQPDLNARMLASGRNGSVWLASAQGLQRHSAQGVEKIAYPPQALLQPDSPHVITLIDDGKILWLVTEEARLMAWDGQRWLPKSAFPLPPHIYLSAAGGVGQLWTATLQGDLVLDDNGKARSYDSKVIGLISGIFPAAQGPLVVSGEHGMAVLEHDQFRLLNPGDPGVLRNVSGLVVSANGDRWLNGAVGVVHIRAADWAHAMADPAAPLRYQLLDAGDGYPGRAVLDSRVLTAATADGRHLWFIGTGGVVTLDTAALPPEPALPPPQIESVVTDAGTLPATSALHLPAGTRQMQINFSSAELRHPERVRFQYRLDGVDTHWQDAGSRRMTTYTNIGPGDYAFHVRAALEGGAAGTDEALLQFNVAPTLIQSLPFKLACALLVLALAVWLYRYRVNALTARVMERVVVKTTERERIARTLHDTVLQTVQALIWRIESLASALPPDQALRQQLERIAEQANAAIIEGRDEVHELRNSAEPELTPALQSLLERTEALFPQPQFELQRVSPSRPLKPGLVEELSAIVGEALHNAARHAEATRISVQIDYAARALLLEVSDNGSGLPPAVAKAGRRAGHWGLLGMRERADRIGARLLLETNANGTRITLRLAARRAYARPAA